MKKFSHRFIVFLSAAGLGVLPLVAEDRLEETEPESSSGKSGIPDSEVMLAVENRVLLSNEVQSKDVDAKVENGIVTLSGKVDNLVASRRAEDLATRVVGVQSIVNQIVVETDDVTDKQLNRKVVKVFANDESFDASEVKVEIENGKASVDGQVDSLAEKRLAEEKLASMTGIREIENNLEITDRTKRSDAEIQEIVSGLLDNAAALDENEIEVEVEEGKVILNGTVASLAQKRKAFELASVAGVAEVDTIGLEVDWKKNDGLVRKQRYEKSTDDSIGAAIRSALGSHPLLVAVADQIQVSVKNAEVELTGKTSRVAMKEAAAEVAADTVGVQGVTNKIQVEWSDETPADQEIAENVRKAVAADAYLTRGEIIARSRDAHVHLYGAVDSDFEKRRAGYVAGMQPGVVHVANMLAVTSEWEPKSDDEIKAAIMTDLKLMETDPHFQVRLSVKEGVPVFTGHVGTWFQWQSLLRLAADAGARRPHIDVDVHYRPTGADDGLYVPR